MRDLKLSYIIGLASLVLCSIAMYLMLGTMLDGQRDFAKIINVAGRQRMLSQRVALFAASLKNGDETFQKPLLETMAMMERAQNTLLHGGDLGIHQALSADARRFYFEGSRPLDPMVRAFIAAGRRFAAEPRGQGATLAYGDLQNMAHTPLLSALDQSVAIFQKEAENRLSWLKSAQEIALGAMLTILTLGTFFVFLPIFKKVSHYTNYLQKRDAELELFLSESKEANAWLQMTEQIGHIGNWRLALPDYAITWSDEMYRIHGVSPETYTPDIESAVAFYHPDDRRKVSDVLQNAIGEKRPFEMQLRLLRKDGALRHIQCRGVISPGKDESACMVFGVFLDVTEQRDIEAALRLANKKLDDMAYIDGLTEIPNRRKFDEDMGRACRLAIRAGDVLSIAMVDVDHFKSYNDCYGHQAGDECLRAIAAAINSVAKRPGDVVARYGGEEFVMLLPSTDAAGALLVAEKARAAVEAIAIEHAKTTIGSKTISISIGLASSKPGRLDATGEREKLIAEADAMLYEAKRNGRNRVMSRSQLKKGIPLPPDETARLSVLAAYKDAGATMRTPELDHIAHLAATLMDAPIALVSIVGEDEQTFAGNFGLEGVASTGKDVSFCAHAIVGVDPLVVHDATADPRFEDNALVTGELGIRYYAGAPIVSKSTGHHLGALCIIDKSTRTSTSATQRALISELAGMAAALIEDKSEAARRKSASDALDVTPLAPDLPLSHLELA